MNKMTSMIAGLALIVGLAGGYMLSGSDKQEAGTQPEVMAKGDGPCAGGVQPLAWRNPMNPAITSPVFTQDEMGMDYLPICAEGTAKGSAPSGTVRIDPTVVQDIGVRTTKARKGHLAREVRSVGRVTFDEEKVARLHPKVDGWVEQLFVDKTGEQVKQDTMLLSVYSPQLITSAEEYLLALKNWQTLKDSPFTDVRDGAKRLLASSLDRLHLLDVPDHQLKEIRETGRVPKALHIHSPFDGTVMAIGAREGSRITPQTELYMIADLSKVWVLVDLYEDELPWVKVGDTAEMRLPAVPGRVFAGTVSYIYPYLDAKTRTNKVRIEFSNPEGLLKPDMYANIILQANPQMDAVIVPSEAVVRSGKRDQVFVERAPGRFEPREVQLGMTADHEVQVLSGVQPGEKVVISSQFLIDSESKLNEATAKMLEPAHEDTPATDMPVDDMQMDGMDMGDMNMEGMSMPSGATGAKP